MPRRSKSRAAVCASAATAVAAVAALALQLAPAASAAASSSPPDVNVECPNQCSLRGLCHPNVATGLFECSCANGFFGADCSRRACPVGAAWADVAAADDDAHALAECSGRGHCNYDTGACDCADGFEGIACERLACPASVAGVVCSGHGLCLSMAAMGAYTDDVSALSTAAYDDGWDADKIYGCACDVGWDTAFDCSVPSCPFGDDPLTTGQVDEEQELTCVCDTACTGGLVLSFRGQPTTLLAYDADAATVEAALEALSTVNDVEVDLTGDLCNDGTESLTVTFVANAGDVPMLRVVYSSLESTALTPPGVVVVETVAGTREYAECNGRGHCDRVAGACACDAGYMSSDGAGGAGKLGDCGHVNTTELACPAVTRRVQVGVGDGEFDGFGYETIPCGRFGTCEEDHTCTCFDGWSGHACTQRDCPRGIAWFDDAAAGTGAAHAETECSNRGVCDRAAGVCECQTGFVGAACQRMACPAGTGDAECSGAGACVSMRTLARARRDEAGDPDPATYGTVFSAAATWDADKVQGCLCTDDSVFGFDCSLRRCPTGGPPGPAATAVPERHTIECTSSDAAADTSVEVTFRGRTTATLLGSSTAAEVEAALEAIGAGDVAVSIASGGALCDAGDTVTVEFLEQFGTVALLKVASATSTLTLAVERNQTSTQLDTECASLGMCDYDTGLCECFNGYASSDGRAGRGRLGDCGFEDDGA